MSQRPTLADVASRAGVSRSTASLAFSGAGPVAPGTRRRVREAAAELGYHGPDPVAASLRRGRSGLAGVVVGDRIGDAFRDPLVVAVVDAVVTALAPAGLAPVLLPLTTEAASGPARQFSTAPLDIVIFATGALDDEPALARLRSRGVPVIGIEGPRGPDVVLVAIADRAGSAAAARHLVALGHRRVAVVVMPWLLDGRRGPLDAARRARRGFADAEGRLAGVEDVLEPTAVYECAASTLEEGELAGATLLAGPSAQRPTAIVAQSDVLAAGVLRAALDRGLDIPGDLSVVGFDGVRLPWLRPHELTTLAQPVTAKGESVGVAVKALLAGERPPDVELPVTLRPGTTTGPPRGGGAAHGE